MEPVHAAQALRAARSEQRTLERFTATHPELDEAWGYAVQAADRVQRVGAGERVVGAKLGLTSAAKQQRMGIDRPIVGFLTDTMLLEPGDLDAVLGSWAQPRIEPEVAFRTGASIDRGLSLEEAAAAVASLTVAAEVIDSRWTGYSFGLPDVIADNTSAAGVLVAERSLSLEDVGELAGLRCEVAVDGEVVHRASGAAILGDPLRAVQLLSEHLERRGESLPPDSLVLAGALTDAVPLLAGHRYRLAIEELGDVTVAP